MLVGYARVSTKDQNLESQVSKLKEAGCEEIYEGKFSGVGQASEDALKNLIQFIRKGDTVVVTRLDRLGRSLKSIINTIDEVSAKGATLKSLDGALDTSSNSPMSKAMVNLLGVFAQLERDLIADRTSDGQKRAKAAGKHIGRPTTFDSAQIRHIKSSLAAGETVTSLAKQYGVVRATIAKYKTKAR